VLCVLWPKTLQGADIAFDIEGHISLVAAAIPYDPPSATIFIPPFHDQDILTGSAKAWNAIVGNDPELNRSSLRDWIRSEENPSYDEWI
jgi:hypothetical protein